MHFDRYDLSAVPQRNGDISCFNSYQQVLIFGFDDHTDASMQLLRHACALLLFAFLSLSQPVHASDEPAAAKLIMVDLQGCPACLAWKREIKPGYVKSDIGERFPLTEVEVSALENSEYFYLQRPTVFPTFYIVSGDDNVIARIEGYTGGDFFWGYMDYYANALGDQTNQAVSTDR